MTRKHYVAVAEAISAAAGGADYVVRASLRDVASSLCSIFAADNPRFDRARFLTACGFEE